MPMTDSISFLFVQQVTAINSVKARQVACRSSDNIFLYHLPSLSASLEASFMPGILAVTDLHSALSSTANGLF